jgi:co-chaperonin GroES (HSP10)
MKLRPARGLAYVVPISDIPSASKKANGYGVEAADKNKGTEEPYQFRVVAVGASKPTSFGSWIYSQLQVGDIVALSATNSTLRTNRDESGFTLDGQWTMVIDFEDVLGIWGEELAVQD